MQNFIQNGKKLALVVGGSKGIGLAIVKQLIQDGFFVAFTYNNTKPIDSLGTKSIAIKCDITKPEEIENLYNSIQSINIPIVCIVNNVGVVSKRESFDLMNESEIRSVIETNLISPMLLLKKFIPILKRGSAEFGCASIINITSQAATFGGNNLAPYATSKAGLNTFTISLSKELAKFGIRVNAVSPAIIQTDMHNFANQEQKDNLAKTIPLGYIGSPSDVANLVGFLACEKSSYITGSIIPITGGR